MNRYKWIGISVSVIVMAAGAVLAGDDILIAAGTTPNVPVVEGVERTTITGEQPGIRLRIMEDMPVSYMLYELVPKEMTERVFSGKAALRCVEGKGPVYLEMLCWIDGNGPFFSRARQTPIPADGKWREYTVPFFLEPEMHGERIQIGVRAEGPCTVEVGDVRLCPDLSGGGVKWVLYLGPLLGVYYPVAARCATHGLVWLVADRHHRLRGVWRTVSGCQKSLCRSRAA